MGLTSALYSGLSGLSSNGTSFEVIGNNIANVNTTGFKARRVLFQSQFSRTLNIGSAAEGGSGGSNPVQIGLGSKVAGVDTDFTMGSVEVTGIQSDLAIEGLGFFVLKDETGQNTYSRNGAFSINNQGYMVSSDGKFVQGFQADSNFNIIPGATGDLAVPLGFLTVARATGNATIQGNLKGNGDVATAGSILDSMLLQAGPGVATGVPVTDDTLLTNVYDAVTGAQLFQVGDVITIGGNDTQGAGATKGGRTLPGATFTVTAASRLGNSVLTQPANRFVGFLQGAMGIDGDATLPNVGAVTIAGSKIHIAGNWGSQNDIDLSQTALRVNQTDAPFSWNKTRDAAGESVYSSFTVYDSLGTPMTMDLTFVLETKASTGNTWRFYATSADDTDINLCLGNGTLQVDTAGQYVTSTGTSITIDRANTGAVTPQSVSLDLTTLTSLAVNRDKSSEIALSSQDGVPIGTLSGFGVGTSGVVTGTFTNGLTRALGQVALATFANPKGLLDSGNSTYVEGPNSGVAVVGAPQAMSAGSIQSGSLELSNVDLSQEFVDLITTSTGFSANSRVITTANDMLREILTMGR